MWPIFLLFISLTLAEKDVTENSEYLFQRNLSPRSGMSMFGTSPYLSNMGQRSWPSFTGLNLNQGTSFNGGNLLDQRLSGIRGSRNFGSSNGLNPSSNSIDAIMNAMIMKQILNQMGNNRHSTFSGLGNPYGLNFLNQQQIKPSFNSLMRMPGFNSQIGLNRMSGLGLNQPNNNRMSHLSGLNNFNRMSNFNGLPPMNLRKLPSINPYRVPTTPNFMNMNRIGVPKPWSLNSKLPMTKYTDKIGHPYTLKFNSNDQPSI